MQCSSSQKPPAHCDLAFLRRVVGRGRRMQAVFRWPSLSLRRRTMNDSTGNVQLQRLRRSFARCRLLSCCVASACVVIITGPPARSLPRREWERRRRTGERGGCRSRSRRTITIIFMSSVSRNLSDANFSTRLTAPSLTFDFISTVFIFRRRPLYRHRFVRKLIRYPRPRVRLIRSTVRSDFIRNHFGCSRTKEHVM